MEIIGELKQLFKMEVRSNSRGEEYLEAVISKKDVEGINSVLAKHFGPAVKEAGVKTKISKDAQTVVDCLGGLRIEQSLYYSPKDSQAFYAVLWPWQSDPERITLKIGILE